MSTEQRTITVTVDLAPDDDEAFRVWCVKQGFNYLNGGRRAWCSEFSSYFRGSDGVATTTGGERFLFAREDEDVVPDEPEHDCDTEYRHDCARCNGVAPGDVGTW